MNEHLFNELYTYFNFIDFFKKFIIRFLVKITYKHADLLISNSAKVAKDISDYTSLKTHFIYPGAFKGVSLKKKIFLKEKFKLFGLEDYHKKKELRIY